MRFPSGRSAAPLIHVAGWPLLGLLGAARLGLRRRGSLLDFVDTWASYPLAGWPLLAPVAVSARSAGLGLLAGLGSALAAESARRVLARGQAGRVAGPTLRVLSANVLGTNPDPTALAGLIARERPDLALLQEVRPAFGAKLVERVGEHLPYHELSPHLRFGGAALLSRRPLEAVACFRLAGGGHYCQRARMELAGRSLRVFNIHLETPYELHPWPGRFPSFRLRHRPCHARDRQVEELLDLVAEIDGPLLVGGDFNAAAGSRPHRLLLRRLRDAYLEAGRGLGHTFPRPTAVRAFWLPAPLLRIDYVFVQGSLDPLRARTLDHPGSDHRAVLVDLALAAPRGA